MSEYTYDGFTWTNVDAVGQRVMDWGSEGLARDPDTVHSYYAIAYDVGPNTDVYIVKYLRDPTHPNGREVSRALIHTIAGGAAANVQVRVAVTGGVVIAAIGTPTWLWVYYSNNGGVSYNIWYSSNTTVSYDNLALRAGGGDPFVEAQGRVYVITETQIHYYNPEGGVGWRWFALPGAGQTTGNLGLQLKDRIQDDVLYYLGCWNILALGVKWSLYTIRGLDTAAPTFNVIYTTVNDAYLCRDGVEFIDDRIIVAFTSVLAGPVNSIYVFQSTDWGVTFSPETVVAPRGLASWPCKYPAMAFDSETKMIFIACQQDAAPPPNKETYFFFGPIDSIDTDGWSDITYLQSLGLGGLNINTADIRSLIFDNNRIQILIHDNVTHLWWFVAKFEAKTPQENARPQPYPENRRRQLPRVTNFTIETEIYIDTDGDEIPDDWVSIPIETVTRTRAMNEISELSTNVPNLSSIGKTDVAFELFTLLDLIYNGMPIRIKMEWENEAESSQFQWFYGLLSEFSVDVNTASNMIDMTFYDELRPASNRRCYNSGTGAVIPNNPSNPCAISLHIAEFLTQAGISYYQDCVDAVAPDDLIAFDLSFDRTETIIDALRRHCEYAKYYFYWDHVHDFLYFRHWKLFEMDYVHHAFVIGDSRYEEYKTQLENRFYNTIHDNIYPMLSSSVQLSVERVVNTIYSQDNNTPPNTDFYSDTDSQDDYGEYMTDGTEKQELNTGTCVNNLVTLTQVDQNKVNRDSRPWIEAKIATIGQKDINPGDMIFINDRVGGVDKSENRIWRVEKIVDRISQGEWNTEMDVVSQRTGRPCSDEIIEAAPDVREWLYCGKVDGVMRYAGQTFTIPGSGTFCKWAVVMDAPVNRPPPLKAVVYNVDAVTGVPTTYVAESTNTVYWDEVHGGKYTVFRFDVALGMGTKYYIVAEMQYEPLDGQYYKVGVDNASPYMGGELIEMYGEELLLDIAQNVLVNRGVGNNAGGQENFRGNTFTSPRDATIIALEQWVSSIINNPSDYLMHLYDTLAGVPNNSMGVTYAVPNGSISVGAYNKFSMVTLQQVLNGLVYASINETAAAAPGPNNRYQVGFDNTNPYAGGQHYFRQGVGYPPPLPWNPDVNLDAVMRIYETGPSFPPEHPIIDTLKDVVCKFFNEG